MTSHQCVEPFQLSINGGTAYWMARCAKTVYQRKQDGSPDANAMLADLQREDPGFVGVVPFHNDNSSAVLVEHADYFTLAFRGTDELRDWLDNANLLATTTDYGEFHRGFHGATERIWPQIYTYYQQRRSQVRKDDHKPKGLFLTGHSLGGAMAIVAAAQLVHHDVGFTGVYTFGQPRAVRPRTADLLTLRAHNRIHRFQNNNDVVPRVPARMMGYSHCGNYMHIMQNKTIVHDPGLWLRFLDAKDGILDDITDRDLATFEDHMMEDYLLAIEQWRISTS